MLSPPVHQQRGWRHLQRAVVSAHPALGTIVQRHFIAHFAPAASLAVWILQHRPDLAQRRELHILVANATEFEALDSGRWFQFIPWLLGRPGLQVQIELVGQALVNATPVNGTPARAGADTGHPDAQALELRLRSHSWTHVKSRPPARLHQGTLPSWRAARAGTGTPGLPDLCAIFSPAFSQHHDALLGPDGLVPLLREGVPLALFSPSEAEQQVDAYTLRSFGLEPLDAECWPNPWAMPVAGSEREGAYANLGWAAEFTSVPSLLSPPQRPLLELEDALDYVRSLLDASGDDAFLTLGEPLRTAAVQTEPADPASVLLRLPHDVAVDPANGHLYQLQDVTALLLESVPAIPIETLRAFPGHDDLVRRAVWAVSTHRAHVAPFAQFVDDALRSQFSALDEPARVPASV